MAPFGTGLFTWFADHKWAQAILLLGVGYIIMRWKEEIDEKRGVDRERRRNLERARKVGEQVKRESNEKSVQADIARDRVLGSPVPAELPDGFRRRAGGS
ncbi:hypothetical protein [Henriciella pelagia]|uniref:hypothetical protein n=1 Tax=Henriciella pelagia TaxID=1977912 RepID=UPI0035197641